MIAVKWSRRGSWHLQVSPASPRTLCGRPMPSGGFVVPWALDHEHFRAEPPGDEKTCERCAVIAVKRGLVADSGSDYGTFEGAPV